MFLEFPTTKSSDILPTKSLFPPLYKYNTENTGIPWSTVLLFIALHRCCNFLRAEGKILHQQKYYDSFLVVV